MVSRFHLVRLLPLALLLLSPPDARAQERVVFVTDAGEIEVEVDSKAAPVSSANFLKYVDGGFYDGGIFHRTVTPHNQPNNKVKIEVIQGGINEARRAEEFPPIALERTSQTGLTHKDGCFSMARDTPDTATSDFFICVGDQPELDFGGKRNPDGQGFAVFGRVVRGMDVVKKIQQSPADGQTLKPPIKIRSAKRVGAASVWKVEDLGFIAGNWQGELGGGYTEEYWSAPRDGNMMAVFRYIKNGKLVFYELLAIEQGPSGPVLKLKHFNPGLIGWEEKAEVFEYPLVESGPNVAAFERPDKDTRMIFRRTGPQTLEVDLVQQFGKRKQTFKYTLLEK